MKKTAFISVLAFMLAMLSAWPAQAQQAPTGNCNGEGAMQGQFSLTPASGPSGSTALLSGSTQLQPAVNQENITVDVWWLETGNEQYLGALLLIVDEDTLIATFSGNITVPSNVALGPQPVAFMLPVDSDPACLTFTVTSTVRDSAYAAATSLPDTGAGTDVTTVLALLMSMAVCFVCLYWFIRRSV